MWHGPRMIQAKTTLCCDTYKRRQVVAAFLVREHGGGCNEREEKHVCEAIAPLLLGPASHRALFFTNCHRVNLKPHPGVFLGRSKYLPQSRDSVRPCKSSWNWAFGEVPTVECLTVSIKMNNCTLCTPVQVSTCNTINVLNFIRGKMSQQNLNGWLLLLGSSSSLLSTPKGEQWRCTNSPSEQVVRQQLSIQKPKETKQFYIIGTAM